MLPNELNQLYRFALSLCHDENDAYDLVQSCVEKLLRQAKDKHQKSYAFTIIRNEFIDRQRWKKRYEHTYFEEESSVIPLNENHFENLLIERNEVEKLLGSLLPEERELLYCNIVEGMTAQEIADLRQQPRGTILSQLHRLKRKIKRFSEQPQEAPA